MNPASRVTKARRVAAPAVEGDLQRQRARATFLTAPAPKAAGTPRLDEGVELLGQALAALRGGALPTARG